jgi:hypothetical protein
MNAQVKGLAVTAAVAYVLILAYHKGMLPMAGGPKKLSEATPPAPAGG